MRYELEEGEGWEEEVCVCGGQLYCWKEGEELSGVDGKMDAKKSEGGQPASL